MPPDATPGLQGSPDSPAKPPRFRLQHVFLGGDGLRAGWRLFLYIAVAFLLTLVSEFVASFFPPLLARPPKLSGLFFQEIGGFAIVFGAALFMARLERRPAGVYGLPWREAFGKRFWIGACLGLLEVFALVGSIALCGGYSFGLVVLSSSALFRWALVWTVFFVSVGLFEEFLFRGYTQFTLADGIGFWPAAVVLSVAFGAVHLRNPGEDWPGVASIVVTGIVFAFALRRTGNLWMLVGWHASFDFGETFLFSVPNSGIRLPGHLSDATLHGPLWLTGGDSGPEASVFSFLFLGLAALAVHKLYPASKAGH